MGEAQFLYVWAVGTPRGCVTAEVRLPQRTEALPQFLREGLGDVYQRM